MYRVIGDGKVIYDDIYPTESARAVNPKLTLKDNSAGALEIMLPPGNAGYDVLERLKSEIIVHRDDEEIWSGRIISEKTDFWNNRVLTCEGELAYLNDTTQPPHKYELSGSKDTDVRDFLKAVIEVHNNKIKNDSINFGGPDKTFKIELGAVTVHEVMGTVYTDNESTFDAINTQLIEKFGGHLRIRKVNGTRYLDYLADYPSTNSQIIRFGQNLLDFTKNKDAADFVTVVTPKGAALEKSSIDGLNEYLDVSSVNGGSRYVTNEEGIKQFGWIEAVAEWDDISDPAELLEQAKKYLSEQQFDNVVLELKAVDLRYLGVTSDSIGLLDTVRCVSRPHGMDREFPVTELTLQFDNPENSTYVLNSEVSGKTASSSSVSHTIGKVDKQPTPSKILKDAKHNATQILNSAMRGYVNIVRNKDGAQSIDITSDLITYNPTDGYYSEQTRVWRWNVKGLGYSTDGGRTYGLAIAMDGSITADYITTGTMSADRIRTGMLMSEDGNVVWNLNEEAHTYKGVTYPGGSLTMRRGSISLGEPFGNWSGAFCVDEEGNIRASQGTIGGFVIEADSIYNDVLNLNSNGLDYYLDKKLLGMYGTQYWSKNADVYGMTVTLENNTGYIAWSYKQLASDDTYTIKLMYTSKDLIDDDGGIFKADRLHLGTYMSLNHCGFEYSYNSSDYQSMSIFTSSGGSKPQALELVANMNVRKDGSFTYDTISCYICNGIIMGKI